LVRSLGSELDRETVQVEFLETTRTWVEWARVKTWACHDTSGRIELIRRLN